MNKQESGLPASSEKPAGPAKRFFRRIGDFLALDLDGVTERTRTPADRQAVALERIAAIAVAQNALSGTNVEAIHKTPPSGFVFSGSYSKDWPIIQQMAVALNLVIEENVRLRRDLQWQQVGHGPEHTWEQEFYSPN